MRGARRSDTNSIAQAVARGKPAENRQEKQMEEEVRVVGLQCSAQIDKLIPALIAARRAFPPITKAQTALIKSEKGEYSYNYADLNDVFTAVQPGLLANDVLLVLAPSMGIGPDAKMVTIQVECWLFHASGQWMRNTLALPSVQTGRMNAVQAIGSIITYATRYNVQSILGIATEDDDAGKAGSEGLQGGGQRQQSQGGGQQQRPPQQQSRPEPQVPEENKSLMGAIQVALNEHEGKVALFNPDEKNNWLARMQKARHEAPGLQAIYKVVNNDMQARRKKLRDAAAQPPIPAPVAPSGPSITAEPAEEMPAGDDLFHDRPEQ
jgi:hypothetical protein